MVMRLFLNGLAMVVVAGDCLQSLVLGHDQVVAHHYTSVQVRFKFTPVLYIKLISSSCRFLLPTRLVHLTKSIPRLRQGVPDSDRGSLTLTGGC